MRHDKEETRLDEKYSGTNSNDNDIAVIGMSGRFPMAGNLEEFWLNLKRGKYCVGDIPEARVEDWRSLYEEGTVDIPQFGYMKSISRFDSQFFNIPPGEADLIDPAQRLLLEVVYHALEYGGYGGKRIANTRTGVFIACGNSRYSDLMSSTAYSMTAEVGNLPAVSAGRVSHFFDLRGPSLLIDTACSSSLAALHYACESLKREECSMTVVGAVNVYAYLGSKVNGNDGGRDEEAISNRLRVFDDSTSGVLNGEGVGALLLKPLSRALKDGDVICAVIKGTSLSHNGARTAAISGQNPESLAEVIRLGLENAAINPETLSYMEASGTATKMGDPIEIKAISDVFSTYTEKKQFCAIGSVKSNLGHLNHASGLASLIKVILALQHKQRPPLARFEKPNSYIDFKNSPVYIEKEMKNWELGENKTRRAGVSSFSVNGTNCHVIMEEAPTPEPMEYPDRFNILTLSAKNPDSMQKLCAALKESIEKNSVLLLEDVCHTMNTGRGQYEYCLAVVCKNKEECIKGLNTIDFDSFKKIKEKQAGNSDVLWGNNGQRNVPPEAKAVFLFPGGKDAANLLETCWDFYRKGFIAGKYMEECGTFYDLEKYPQVLVFAFQYALAKLWMDLGIKPAFVLGFGIGKYVSRVISGKLNLEEALNICVAEYNRENFFDFYKAKLTHHIAQLYSRGQTLFLEMGFENELGKMTEEVLKGKPGFRVLLSYDPAVKEKTLLRNIGHIYTWGVHLDFSSLFYGRKVALPTYPFHRQRYWVKAGTQLKENNISRLKTSSLQTPPPERAPYAATRSQVEETLTRMWQTFFGIEKIRNQEDFFQLGGDSLRAMTIISEIHKELHVSVPLTEFFSHPTISELTQYIKKAEKSMFSSIEPVEKKEYYPVSPAQRRLYILYQISQETIAYNSPSVSLLQGHVEKERIENTFKKLLKRHQSFRTSFCMLEEEAVQRIHQEVGFQVEYRKMGNGERPDPSALIRPFTLSTAPLLRVVLIRVKEREHILVVDVHHIITDGLSNSILIQDFTDLYAGKELSPLRLQYSDFSQWQSLDKQNQALKTQKEYWLKEFSGEIPVLSLPFDYSPPEIQDVEGSSVSFQVGSLETEALNHMAVKESTTLYVVLLAIFHILLAKVSGQEDIVIGSTAAGRRHVDLGKIIGMFVNILPLRNRADHRQPFIDFLKQVKEKTVNAFDNQDYPFPYEELVEQLPANRDVSRNPLFDVLFSFLNVDVPKVEISGLKISPFKYKSRLSKFDLELSVREAGEKLQLTFEYCTKLFKKETIERFISYFKKIVTSILIAPGKKISGIEIISEQEKKQILFDFNGTDTGYPQDKTIHELFEEQVKRSPDRAALLCSRQNAIDREDEIGETMQLTYKELHRKSTQLARLLKENGILTDSIVGIMVERSIEMIIGIFGILKAGGAYLPIDANYPLKRIKYMLDDSGTNVVVTTGNLAQKEKIVNCRLITVNGQQETPPADMPPGYRVPSAALNRHMQLAYVIYTSGSTGKPKGVMVQHHSIVNILYALFKEYPFSGSDTYLLKTSYLFDVSVSEIFGWFWQGGRLAILERDAENDVGKILEQIEYHNITHINFVPSMFRVFVESLDHQDSSKFSSLKYIFLAGEELLAPTVQEFKEFAPNILLENIYGPTEATVYASRYSVRNCNGTDKIPIGKPLNNTGLYILDNWNNLQPTGIPGELVIAGQGLARGYLNGPELTAEKFISPPTSHFPSTIYKTGDLARWLPDGNIEFLGRIDHQVKIRGFRIELGEIQHHLLSHEKIQDAVVLAKKDNNGNNYLCAYIVSEKEFSVSRLRSYISEKLPNYMVPSYFIPLEKIPLTKNGKVDRKNLPEPGSVNLSRDDEYIAPRTIIEKTIAGIWENVLGINSISINDNFFEVGGDSIKVIRIISRLKMAGYVIEMKHIFRNPRISELVPLVKKIETNKAPEISSCSAGNEKKLTPGDLTYSELSLDVFEQLQEKYSNLIEDIYPLTPMQEGMLFYTLYEDKARPLYFQQTSYRLFNNLNVISFKRTLNELFKRHAILRTVFIYEGLNRPLQVVLKERNVDFYYEDLREAIPNPLDKEIFIREFREKDQRRSFDLGEDVLMRVALFQLTDTEYHVAWSSHHILLDGWCIGILISEFSEIYAAYMENREFHLSPVKPYRTYIQWLEKQEKNKTRNYWKKYLEGYEEIAAVPRKESRGTFEGGYRAAAAFTRFEEDKTIALNKVAIRNRVTLNTVIQVVWGIVLGKYTSKQDTVFAMLVSGRPSEVEGVDSMVGCFINTIPVRITFDQNTTFDELLRIVQDRAIDSEPHHYFSLAEIQVESTLKQNLLDHIIQFQNFPIAETTEDTSDNKGKYEKNERIEENPEPMELSNLNAFEQGGDYNFYITIVPLDQIELGFSYNAGIYDGALVEQLGLNCLRVLEQIIEDDKITIDEIAFLSEEERRKILFEFNNNKAEFSRDKTIYQFVEKYAEMTPDHISVTSTSTLSLTYRELNERANRLAIILKSNGIQKDETVGILMERSQEMVESILTVWKAGGAYIPLDIAYPPGRITGILQDSTTKVLITREAYVNAQLEIDYEGEIVKLDKTYPGMSGEDTHKASTNPDSETPMNSLAYVIYTSGSTGKPKGVMIEHLGMMNHIQAKINHFCLTGNSVVAQNATHTFDISVWQFFVALTLGGTTVIYPNEMILDPEKFVSRIVKDNVTILEVVPAYLSMLLDDEVNQLDLPLSLQYLLVTGEVLKSYLVRRWFDKYPGIKMVNAYGPTEASDDITHYIMTRAPGMERIPIGKPLQNLDIYIVDNRMELCPIGVKGEICVSGVGVGRGYLGDEEKTRQVFVEDPFAEEKGVRLYKTGDLGCWGPDGTIEFFGRKDYQVKIRGFRIELGEIESRLLNHTGIKEAVVIDKEDNIGNKYLCAYVVPHSQRLPGSTGLSAGPDTGLKKYLSESLPDYMIPAHFVPLQNIPLTSSGKIDRKALPEPEGGEFTSEYVAPGSRVEKKLVAIWSDVLEKEESVIGITHSFFDLGGHSLKAIVLVSKIHKEFDVKLPLPELFKTPTIRDLAQYVEKAVEDRFTSIEPVEKKEYYVLSSAQKRLYIEQQMDMEGSAYNLSQVIMLNDAPDKKKLQDTFQKLIDRHESLRTSFHLVDEVPVQKVHEHVDFFVDDFETDEKKARRIAERYQRGFDLGKAPLLRAVLFNVEQKHHVLLVVMHHIITDGMSYPILENDFNAFYEEKKLPPLKIQYKEYAEWQNSPGQQEVVKKQEKYWLKEFDGEIPVLNLSTGYENPEGSDVGGSGIRFVINKEETAALRKLTLEEGATLYMMLLTLFNILLSKVSGQEDIVIGTPSAGRGHADLKQIIGMFVNTLALRNYPIGGKTFKEFFKEVKERTLKAFENQDYQFEDLVGNVLTKRDTGQNPLFDVMFAMQNQNEPGENALEIDEPKPYKANAKFDLFLTAVETEENIALDLICKAGLLTAETIERFSRYFGEIITSVLGNGEIEIMDIKISHELFDQKLEIPREEEGDFGF